MLKSTLLVEKALVKETKGDVLINIHTCRYYLNVDKNKRETTSQEIWCRDKI